jgi:mannose-6-phosphate isomerase-like protein (cupin superfamily)
MNLIYVRPQSGLSIQDHTKRTEDWKVIQGHPLIIANSRIHYSVQPGDNFHTRKGKYHAIFNNTDNWVVIEERYTGTFEEKDIIRVFNPNRYY